ncbi:hypothetical protein NL676_027727 [Syzygium grande]|nr:hypothetical protein NL676_027727 [Syzygium grande]
MSLPHFSCGRARGGDTPEISSPRSSSPPGETSALASNGYAEYLIYREENIDDRGVVLKYAEIQSAVFEGL